MGRMQRYLLTLTFLLLCVGMSGQTPKITVQEDTYDFGCIEEVAGAISYTFDFINDGDAPLVIKRVLTSCGCSQPEWDRAPIAPGASGKLKITYDPTDQFGPFLKTLTIFSNAEEKKLVLYIKGQVIPRPDLSSGNLTYSIGSLQFTSGKADFGILTPNSQSEQRLYYKNNSSDTLMLKPGVLPSYIEVKVLPDTIYPNEIGDVRFMLNTSGISSKGHHQMTIPFLVAGKKKVHGKIKLSANITDDFSKLSPIDIQKAPKVVITPTLLDCSSVIHKKGFLGLGKKSYIDVEIANTGQSPLHIYSITVNNDRWQLSAKSAEVSPGEMLKLTLTPLKTASASDSDTLITLVTNDPSGPVRIIKVKF